MKSSRRCQSNPRRPFRPDLAPQGLRSPPPRAAPSTSSKRDRRSSSSAYCKAVEVAPGWGLAQRSGATSRPQMASYQRRRCQSNWRRPLRTDLSPRGRRPSPPQGAPSASRKRRSRSSSDYRKGVKVAPGLVFVRRLVATHHSNPGQNQPERRPVRGPTGRIRGTTGPWADSFTPPCRITPPRSGIPDANRSVSTYRLISAAGYCP